MSLSKLCERISREIHDAVAGRLSAAEKDAIAKAIRQGLADASNHAHAEFTETARQCCGADMDMAHKLQQQADKKRDMLIANLMAMR